MDVYRISNRKHRNCIELVQFTDTHIFSDIKKDFDGINTFESFKRVINLARQENWPPDIILVTGDLVHDPVAQAYRNLLSILLHIGTPVFCLPGNHDVPDIMHSELNMGNVSTNKLIVFDDWIIIMLDTVIENSHSGRLANSELDLLDKVLPLHTDKFSLVCLHHPPVKIGSPWMDAMGLENSADFFSIMDKHENVKGVLWGHIHQEFSNKHNDVLLMASPSTCVQFKPGSAMYTKDDKTAGYRSIRLFNNGIIETSVIRL